jgi:hypothetical protein
MPLIDKDKTVEAVATYLFVNDAIRGPEPKKVRDYLVFAESMLKDVPGLDLVRCKDCRRRFSCITFEGLGDPDGYCSGGERDE